MHPYRQFIQDGLDARGWKPAELIERSGLNRQLIYGILKDNREHLGQMPHDTTLEGIARGFGIPVSQVREAAARSLSRYDRTSADEPLTPDIQSLPLDVILQEIRRRVMEATPRQQQQPQRDNVVPLKKKETPLPPPVSEADAASHREKASDNNQPTGADE